MENTQEKHPNLISAEILADSLNQFGERITTFKLVFPRYILAELNTHRLFSKNSASSRAIPFNKMIKSVIENPFIPMAWQKDHKGMQGTEYLSGEEAERFAPNTWLRARDKAVEEAIMLNNNIGVTKQLCNRLLEPFLYHTVLLTATEFENFFELRCPSYEWEYEEGTIKAKSKEEFLEMFIKRYPTNGEKDLHDCKAVDEDFNAVQSSFWLFINKGAADIHIMDLAEKMYDAYNESEPKQLKEGEWHIPFGEFNTPQKENNYIDWEAKYIHNKITKEKNRLPFVEELVQESIKTRVKIATARCARISYETLGDNPEINYEKDIKLHDDLLAMGHMSPFEHCSRVMNEEEYNNSVKGKVHSIANEVLLKEFKTITNKSFVCGTVDNSSLGWSRNFKGFQQYREIIE